MGPDDLRVGILWRAEWDPVGAKSNVAEECRLRGMFSAFRAFGIEAEPVVYADNAVEAVRSQLLGLDGVLVWVNPIEQGLDRSKLDVLLAEVADRGVWVSAHPDVILKIATKQVLVDTAEMSWSAPTHLYRSIDQLREELPERLAHRDVVGDGHPWSPTRSTGANPAPGRRRRAQQPRESRVRRFLDAGCADRNPSQSGLAGHSRRDRARR